MMMFWPECVALVSLSIFLSLSSDLFSIRSFLRLFLDSISFDRSSSGMLASLSSHSFLFRSTSFIFCNFACAFFSAFFASYFCCFTSFFWALFDRAFRGASEGAGSAFGRFSRAFLSFCSASIGGFICLILSGMYCLCSQVLGFVPLLAPRNISLTSIIFFYYFKLLN